MKKKLLVLGMVLLTLLQPLAIAADELVDLTKKMYPNDNVQAYNRPKSSLVIDANTGDVLWKDNIDEVRDPASMSKLMTLYLLFESMKQGKVSKDAVVTATASDQAISKIYEISNNNIVAGVDYTVPELITMTVVPSSNVATIMLANLMSNNNPDAFIDRMNEKAKELGMTNTTWNNPSGAAISTFQGLYNSYNYPNEMANQTTARDLAILVYHFIKEYPDILNYTNQAKVTVKEGTPYEETFDTYNYSLPGAKYALKGVDGLKTGSSPRGAFNYIATIKRGNQRLISVVMGVGDWSDQDGEYYRHPFGNALIEKAFADYRYKKLLDKGVQTIDGKTYTLDQPFYATVKKGEENPKLVVKNGLVEADSGLMTLSEKISDGLPVKEGAVNQSDTQSTVASTTRKSFRFPLESLVILIPIGILAMILYIERARRKERALKAQNRYKK